jgi:hypothetical protein
MLASNKPEHEPIWWIAEYTIVWEKAEPSLRQEFERRFRDQEKRQGPDNSVIGRTSAPRNVDVEHAYAVPDDDWETGLIWDDARRGLRFGIGVREKYSDLFRWTDDLEQKLRDDWGKTYQPNLWQGVKRAVRRGFEHKSRASG